MNFIDQEGWESPEDPQTYINTRSKLFKYLPSEIKPPQIKARYALHDKGEYSLPLKTKHRSSRLLQLPKLKNASVVEVKSFQMKLEKQEKEKKKEKGVEFKSYRHRRLLSEQETLDRKKSKRKIKVRVRKLQLNSKPEMKLKESSLLSDWGQARNKAIDNVKVLDLPPQKSPFL